MAATPSLYSDLTSNAALWPSHDPPYADIMNVLGSGATNRADVMSGVVGLATRTPIVMAFVIQGDEDHVYMGHSPMTFPTDPLNTTPFDGRVVVFVGNDIASAVPMVLPLEHFGRSDERLVLTHDTILGPTGHGAVPPVYRSGPHATGAPNTHNLRARRVLVMPPSMSTVALTTQPGGRYTLAGFYNTFLRTEIDSGDAARVTAIEPARDWWRCASTNLTGGVSMVRAQPLMSPLPGVNARLNQLAADWRSSALAKLGVGGPALSSTTFTAGVNSLNATLDRNASDALAFQRASGVKTFTDKYGAAAAARMHNLCNVTSDADLPETHALLVNCPKERRYAVLNAQLLARAVASQVPLTASMAPIATPKLVEEVFVSLAPCNSGLKFGSGLSPFAMLCEGHAETDETRALLRKAEMVHGGTTVSLSDASALITDQLKIPSTAQTMAEKLYAWSVAIDLFHGTTHPLSVSVRQAVCTIGPLLSRVAAMEGDNSALATDLVCRLSYELQQDYFMWGMGVSTSGHKTPPTFERIKNAVMSNRPDTMASLPPAWYHLFSLKKYEPRAQLGTNPQRAAVGAAPTVNPRGDERILSRFARSGHASISAMMDGKDAEIPSHRGNPVCLSWALKGRCSNSCKRKDQHVPYPQGVVTKLHELLDKCGVVNAQP